MTMDDEVRQEFNYIREEFEKMHKKFNEIDQRFKVMSGAIAEFKLEFLDEIRSVKLESRGAH